MYLIEPAFDNQPMGAVEAVLTYGMSGWPTWVHHAHRDQHWRVLEIIEPSTGPARPAGTGRYILRVHGPLAYLTGREGSQYITALRRDGRWWIEPNSTAYPRRGTPPGELRSSTGSASCAPTPPAWPSTVLEVRPSTSCQLSTPP